MSIVPYAWGVVVFVGSVGALVLGSGAVVSRAMPWWRGPVRVLAQVAVAFCWVYAVSYVLGAVGLFRPVPLFGLVDGGALAAWLVWRRPDAIVADPATEETPEPEARQEHRVPVTAWLAGLGAALVGAAWLPGTAHAFRFGILEPDSIWYHGHFSARFVQTGWTTRINPVGIDALVPFHMANRELLDAVMELPWHRDFVLPATNLVYLALLFLAGWCIGARWGRGPVAMLAATVVAAPPVMILSHPGSLKNDLLGMTLLLAAVALFVHSEGRLPAVALAGATLGLAAGTKSNLLLLTVALVGAGALVLATGTPVGPETAGAQERRPPRARWIAAATWAGTTALFGAYWYVRNWVRAGNPLPWLDIHLGPLHLSQVAPGDGTRGYTNETIIHHIHEHRFLDNVIRVGLRLAFGNLWWCWAALLVFSLALVVFGRSRWLGVMAAVGVLGMFAHLITPLSLVVPADNPGAAFNFAYNTRYALAAISLILVAGACATRGRVELVFSGAALAVIVSGLFPTQLSVGASHDAQASDTPLTLVLGALVLVLVGGAFFRTRLPTGAGRWMRLAVLPLAALLAVAALPAVNRYTRDRYATVMPKLPSLLWPTTSRLEHARIGIATAPVPYPSEGADLSNRVSYIGVPTKGGVLRNVTDCHEWGQRVRALQLTDVALAPEPFVMRLSPSTLEAWTLAIPGTRVAWRAGDEVLISVPHDPAPTPATGCPSP